MPDKQGRVCDCRHPVSSHCLLHVWWKAAIALDFCCPAPILKYYCTDHLWLPEGLLPGREGLELSARAGWPDRLEVASPTTRARLD